MEMASRTLEGPRAPIETLTNSETVRGKAMASEMVPLDGKPTMASRTPGEPLGKPVEGRSFVETLETLSRTPVTEGLAFDYLGRPTDVKLPPPSKGFTGFFEKVGNFLNGKGWQTTHEVVKTEVLSKQGAAPEIGRAHV